MIGVRIIQWIAGLAGLVALTLGLLFWSTGIDVINIHKLLGFLVAFSLLIIGIVGVCTRGLRLLGVVGIVYAPIMLVFGLTQETLLVGNMHWLIQTAHLLVGLGALALMGIIGTRYVRLKKDAVRVVVPEVGG